MFFNTFDTEALGAHLDPSRRGFSSTEPVGDSWESREARAANILRHSRSSASAASRMQSALSMTLECAKSTQTRGSSPWVLLAPSLESGNKMFLDATSLGERERP